MLLIRIILEQSAAGCAIRAVAVSDAMKLSRKERRDSMSHVVYDGSLAGWTGMKESIRKSGKCVALTYEGEGVMSIDRKGQRELTSSILENSQFISDVSSSDRSRLLFLERSSVKELSEALARYGAVVLREHLVDRGILDSPEEMLRYLGGLKANELSMSSGVLEDRKMLRYVLSRLRRMLLPALCAVFIFTLVNSSLGLVLSDKIQAEEMNLHSLRKSRKALARLDADFNEIAASLGRQTSVSPVDAIRTAAGLVPEGLQLTKAEERENVLAIEGLCKSYSELAAYADSIDGLSFVESVSLADVKDNPGNGGNLLRDYEGLYFKMTVDIK